MQQWRLYEPPKRAFTHAAVLSLLHLVRKGVCLLGMAVLVSLPGSSAWAGGSFAREDLRPILDQQPVMANGSPTGWNLPKPATPCASARTSTRVSAGGASAIRHHWPKPKGASGPFTLEVTVETELICRKRGRESRGRLPGPGDPGEILLGHCPAPPGDAALTLPREPGRRRERTYAEEMFCFSGNYWTYG